MQYKRGEHPNSLKNLEKGKFKKGQVTNPRGRPPNELSLTNLTRESLNQVCPYDSKGRTWKEYIVDKWLTLSAENPSFFRELIERLEGKVVQPVDTGVETKVTWVIGKGYLSREDQDREQLEARQPLAIDTSAQSVEEEPDPDKAVPLNELMGRIQRRHEQQE